MLERERKQKKVAEKQIKAKGKVEEKRRRWELQFLHPSLSAKRMAMMQRVERERMGQMRGIHKRSRVDGEKIVKKSGKKRKSAEDCGGEDALVSDPMGMDVLSSGCKEKKKEKKSKKNKNRKSPE